MNGSCKTCDVEAQCGYPYKPTECCDYRKFRPLPAPAASVIPITLKEEQK